MSVSAAAKRNPKRKGQPQPPPTDALPAPAPAPLLVVAIVGALVLGAGLAIASILALLADEPPPGPLLGGLLVVALAEIGIATGLGKRHRGAWAFGATLHGVLAVVGVIALPALGRAHVPLAASLAGIAVAAIVCWVLVSVRRAF